MYHWPVLRSCLHHCPCHHSLGFFRDFERSFSDRRESVLRPLLPESRDSVLRRLFSLSECRDSVLRGLLLACDRCSRDFERSFSDRRESVLRPLLLDGERSFSDRRESVLRPLLPESRDSVL